MEILNDAGHSRRWGGRDMDAQPYHAWAYLLDVDGLTVHAHTLYTGSQRKQAERVALRMVGRGNFTVNRCGGCGGCCPVKFLTSDDYADREAERNRILGGEFGIDLYGVDWTTRQRIAQEEYANANARIEERCRSIGIRAPFRERGE